jgi:hypothetical protein
MNTEISYPFTIAPNGDLETTSSRVEQCRQAILATLKTKEGERVYRPEFGLPEVLFKTSQMGALLGAVRTALDEALRPEYADCEYQLKGQIGDDGIAIVIIAYTIEEITDTLKVPISN